MAVSPAVNRIAPAPCTCAADDARSPAREVPAMSSPTPTPAPTPVSSHDPSGHDSPADANRRLRGAILSAARLLLGRSAPYTGELVVKICAPAEGVEVRVKPTGDVSGLEPVDGSATADALLLARLEQLTAHFLSTDERTVLRLLADHEPCSATQISDEVRKEPYRIAKAKFWEIWGQLQHRRLVHQEDAGQYRLAVDWVREMLG